MVRINREMAGGGSGGGRKLQPGWHPCRIDHVSEKPTRAGDPMITLYLAAPTGLAIRCYIPLSNGWRLSNLLDALKVDDIDSDAIIGRWIDAELKREDKYLEVDRLEPCEQVPDDETIRVDYKDAAPADAKRREPTPRERGERPRPRSSYGERGERPRPRSSYGERGGGRDERPPARKPHDAYGRGRDYDDGDLQF